MSIATEITRVNQNLQNAYTALRNKGVTVPDNVNSNSLPSLIDSIPAGGGVGSANGTGDWKSAKTSSDEDVSASVSSNQIIEYINGFWFVSDGSNGVLYSTDGKNYSNLTLPSNATGALKILYINGYYIIVDAAWHHEIYYSKNVLDTWSRVSGALSEDFIGIEHLDDFGWIIAYKTGSNRALTIRRCSGDISTSASLWTTINSIYSYNHMVCINNQCIFYSNSNIAEGIGGIGYLDTSNQTVVAAKSLTLDSDTGDFINEDITWNVSDIKYADGIWVTSKAISNTIADNSNGTFYSIDGENWIETDSTRLNKIFYLNNTWYGYLKTSLDSTIRMSYSLDGKKWTMLMSTTEFPNSVPSQPIDMIYANGMYMIYGQDYVYYSSDGKIFSEPSLISNIGDETPYISKIIYANGIWLASRTLGKSYYSINGITWYSSKSNIAISNQKYAETGIWVASARINDFSVQGKLVYSTSWEP